MKMVSVALYLDRFICLYIGFMFVSIRQTDRQTTELDTFKIYPNIVAQKIICVGKIRNLLAAAGCGEKWVKQKRLRDREREKRSRNEDKMEKRKKHRRRIEDER